MPLSRIQVIRSRRRRILLEGDAGTIMTVGNSSSSRGFNDNVAVGALDPQILTVGEDSELVKINWVLSTASTLILAFGETSLVKWPGASHFDLTYEGAALSSYRVRWDPSNTTGGDYRLINIDTSNLRIYFGTILGQDIVVSMTPVPNDHSGCELNSFIAPAYDVVYTKSTKQSVVTVDGANYDVSNPSTHDVYKYDAGGGNFYVIVWDTTNSQWVVGTANQDPDAWTIFSTFATSTFNNLTANSSTASDTGNLVPHDDVDEIIYDAGA